MLLVCESPAVGSCPKSFDGSRASIPALAIGSQQRQRKSKAPSKCISSFEAQGAFFMNERQSNDPDASSVDRGGQFTEAQNHKRVFGAQDARSSYWLTRFVILRLLGFVY